MEYDKKKVVILGGGYGGLMTAVTLQKRVHPSRVEIYLVNKNDYHYFTTKVHEAGAGTVNPNSIKMPIQELIDPKRVTFIQDEVTGLDIERKKVICKNQIITYDYVVVGIGGTPKTFNIPGLEEHAFFLFNWEGSNRLRKHIEEKFQEFSQKPTGKLNLVIGGTGFTGMEFIHELTKSIPLLCKEYKVVPNDVNIIVIEPNQQILQGFPESIVSDAVGSLRKMGIEYKVGMQVTKVERDKVFLQDGTEIQSDTFIWAGGVTGNPLLEGHGFELLDGRVKVDEYCEVPDVSDVYVIGDASVSFNEKGQPYPPTAQIAIQQGQYCAYNIAMKVYGQPAKPFHYIYRGTVMSLGKGNATGIVYDHHINGKFAALMKWVIEMRYCFMLGGLSLVRKHWKD
ncbi:NAD(P)/FAD-dependent oxidoreductase [Neobacillus drentensis]|uniref:NAD(P)/FAD-dependent oxidoreductase n=1 Tax=Neobacillus drentensis TaxID=220684 RepID=UPI002FFFF30E